MKKVYLAAVLAGFLGFGLTSCNKCQTCGSCPDGVTLVDEDDNEVESQEFCEDDFDNKSDYELTISLAESVGCTCN